MRLGADKLMKVKAFKYLGAINDAKEGSTAEVQKQSENIME